MNIALERLRLAVDDGVACLTMSNPGKRNALDATMRDEFRELIARIQADADIRAMILTGADGHFCAGGDLGGIATANADPGGWRRRLQGLHGWVQDLIMLDKPVIAAVDGNAAGAGFSLALAADFILATPRAKFCMSFMKVGLVPDCGALYTLPRIVGMQRARELMLSARDVDAAEALRLGLAMELHAPEQLLARARELARSFVQASPAAVSMIKRALAAPPDLSALLDLEASSQAVATSTPEHREAVRNFLNKQAPPFRWPVHAPPTSTGEPT